LTGDRGQKGNKTVATKAVHQDLVRLIAEEMAYGVETAVECWMTQIEAALMDTRLTTPDKLNAVHEIVRNYKLLTGKVEFNQLRLD
jgi:hypothetical protein